MIELRKKDKRKKMLSVSIFMGGGSMLEEVRKHLCEATFQIVLDSDFMEVYPHFLNNLGS